MYLIIVIFLFLWACYLSYRVGIAHGISAAYDYIEENWKEFKKDMDDGQGS